jgi:hypothetical protein
MFFYQLFIFASKLVQLILLLGPGILREVFLVIDELVIGARPFFRRRVLAEDAVIQITGFYH